MGERERERKEKKRGFASSEWRKRMRGRKEKKKGEERRVSRSLAKQRPIARSKGLRAGSLAERDTRVENRGVRSRRETERNGPKRGLTRRE